MNENPTITPEALLEHQDFVRSLARSLLFDENQVDDVVQQAWMVALRTGPRQPGALKAWLGAVTRNLSRNQRRGDGRRQKHERRVPPRELAPSAGEIVQREEMRGRVVDAVLALAEPYRSTLVLRYLEELSPKEIAERTGEPASTVRVRVKRGLAQLRQHLDAEMGGDRQAWMLALVPFAAAGAGASVALAAGGAAGLGKWAGAAALALALLGGWWVWDRAEAAQGGEIVEVQEESAGQEAVPDSGPSKTMAKSESGSTEMRRLEGEAPTELPPEAMAGFRGRLIGPDGKPIAGGLVRILSGDLGRKIYARLSPLRSPERARLDQKDERTDKDGRFVFSGIWPNSFHVLAAGRDRQITMRKVLDRLPSVGQVVDLGDVLLPQDPVVRGRVLMPDGRPAVGAWVWATEFPGPALGLIRVPYLDPEGWLFDLQEFQKPRALSLQFLPSGMLDALPLPWTLTDEKGAFELALPEGRNFALVARAAGAEPYVRNRIRARAGRTKDLGSIELKTGESLAGIVHDAAGAPVEGAEVLVAPLPAMRGTLALAFAGSPLHTDVEGRFEAQGLPRGAQILAAVRRGPGEPWIFSKRSHAGDKLRFALEARRDLDLLIVDGRGRPLPGPRVRVFAGGAKAEDVLLGSDAPHGQGHELVEGEKPGQWTIADVSSGPLRVLASVSGYVTRTFDIPAASKSDGDTPIRLTLLAASPVEVTVFGPDRKPVAGATILSRPLDAPSWAEPGATFNLFDDLKSSVLPIREGRTGRSGRLTIRSLAVGKVWLTARHPLHGQVSRLVHLPSRHETLAFPEPCIVEGRIDATAEQLMKHPSMVHLWKIGGNDTEAMPNQPHLMVPDSQGHFRFEGVAPGKYLIQIHPALAGLRTVKELVDHFRGLFWSNLATQRFTLAPGDYKSVKMKWPHAPAKVEKPGTCSITGTFSIDGRGADDVTLQVFAMEGVYSSSRAGLIEVKGGRFEVKGLHKGATFLSFYKGSRVTPEQLLMRHSLILEDRQQAEVRLEVHLVRVTGQVLTADGRPAAGAPVRLWRLARSKQGKRSNTGMSRKLVCDRQGKFKLESIPRGEYVGVSQGPDGNGWNFVDLREKSSPLVEIRLRRGQSVSGSFDPKDWGLKADPGSSYSVSIRQDLAALEMVGAVDAEGRFVIPKVPAGTYRLWIKRKRRMGNVTWTSTIHSRAFTMHDHEVRRLVLRPLKR